MGDFFVDFRPRQARSLDTVREQLRFMKHLNTVEVNEPSFGLVLSHTGEPELWAPYRHPADGTFVAVAGRVSLDEVHWEAAERLDGDGGLAAKAICNLYRERGDRWVEAVGGNAVILLHDPARGEVRLVTDRFGVFPAFEFLGGHAPVYASHPDVLARATGEHGALDEVSMAEFILTSTVTPPFTYYRRIHALPHGSIIAVNLGKEGGAEVGRRRSYIDLRYRGEEAIPESQLAEELAASLRRAVRRRTRKRFGRTAVALSGGLDSRAILACVEDPEQVVAFTCYDEPNREVHVAESIARALGVPFELWRRDFEYYGDNAVLGVRISGGMGTFANNHFLGMVDRLRNAGAENLLTGCYCDYLFKGLPLNRKAQRLSGREQLAPFRHQFYFTQRPRSTPLASLARERWESRVPGEYQDQASVDEVFQVEAHRSLPLCYEGDNQQRVVPQRVLGWFVPIADRELFELYCRLPYHAKLNRAVFTKAVQLLCNDRLASVPDANTGARLDASRSARQLVAGWHALRRRAAQAVGKSAADGSWPDWAGYVSHSRKLAELWNEPNPEAVDLFKRVVGAADFRSGIREYQGRDLFLMVSLLTLKLWLDHRV